MSTILKALRRLEEDKAREGAPRPLREEVAAGPRERSRRRRGAPVALFGALLLGAGIGASAWYFWPYERSVEPVDVAALAAPTEAPAAAEPEPAQEPATLAVEPEAEVAALPDEALESEVEVVQRPPAEPRIAPVPPKPAAAAPPPERRSAVARKRIAARAQPDPITNPPPAPAVAAAPQVAAPTPEPVAAAPARPAEPAAPVREDDRDWPVSGDFQEPELTPEPTRLEAARSAPSFGAEAFTGSADEIRVKRTAWHPERARRSAELAFGGSERSVREGDVLGDYVVSEIKPTGVVLSRGGQPFERRIGK